MKAKTPRLYVCVDQGMIWEAYSDIPLKIIIKNVDRSWIRFLDPVVNPRLINENEELAEMLTEEEVPQDGLEEEQAKHQKTFHMKGKGRKS